MNEVFAKHFYSETEVQYIRSVTRYSFSVGRSFSVQYAVHAVIVCLIHAEEADVLLLTSVYFKL